MSDAKIREFYESMETNENFYKMLLEAQNNNKRITDKKEKLSKIIEEAVIPFAKKSGYNFTLGELLKYEEKKSSKIEELDINSLDVVSGGIGRRTAGTLLALLTVASGIGTAGSAFAETGDVASQTVSSMPVEKSETDAAEITSIKDRMKLMKGTLEKVIRPGVSPEDVFKERVATKRAEKSKSPGPSAASEGSSFSGVKLMGTIRNAMTGNPQPAFTLVNWYNTYVSQFNLMVMQSNNDQAALAYDYAQEVASALTESSMNEKQQKLIKASYELFKVAYEKWSDNLDGNLPEGCKDKPTDPLNDSVVEKTSDESVGLSEAPAPPPPMPVASTSKPTSVVPNRSGLLADIGKGVKLRKTSGGSSGEQKVAAPQEKKQEQSPVVQQVAPKNIAVAEAKSEKAQEVKRSGYITTYDKTLKNGESTTLVYNSRTHVLDGDVSELTTSDLNKLGVKYDFESRNAVPLGEELQSNGWGKVTKLSGAFRSNYRYARVVSEKTSTDGVALTKERDGNVYIVDNRPNKSLPVKLTKEDLEKVKSFEVQSIWSTDRFELPDDAQSSWEKKDGWVYYGYYMK